MKYLDYSYTLKYDSLDTFFERELETIFFIRSLIESLCTIDTFDYTILIGEREFIILFYGKGYFKSDTTEIYES